MFDCKLKTFFKILLPRILPDACLRTFILI